MPRISLRRGAAIMTIRDAGTIAMGTKADTVME